MKKIKRILILSSILIIVGIVGAIPAGIYGIPKFIRAVESGMDNVSSELVDIATFSEDIETLNIDFDCNNYSVEVKESKDDLLHIKVQKAYLDNTSLEKKYHKSSKTLFLKTKLEGNKFDISALEEGIISSIKNFNKRHYNTVKKMIIEVPKGVNLDIKQLGNSSNSEFIVEDNKVLKDYFKISYSLGEVELPYFNTLNKVNINHNEELELDIREFINAENVDIKGTDVVLYSGGEISNYDIKNISKNVKVLGRDLTIESFIPLGKNVTVSSEMNTYIQMPFDQYNLSGEIKNSYIDYIEESVGTEDQEGEFPIVFDNMKLNTKGTSYKGKYSSATGEEYKMNIYTPSGHVINNSQEYIEKDINERLDSRP